MLQESQKREDAERSRLLVAAQREEASQAVKTVEATATAQRDAKIRLIEAEREAQKQMIEQKNKIELDALRKQREAESQRPADGEEGGVVEFAQFFEEGDQPADLSIGVIEECRERLLKAAGKFLLVVWQLVPRLNAGIAWRKFGVF